jgi:23S rRNA pseudouridine2604 synthase
MSAHGTSELDTSGTSLSKTNMEPIRIEKYLGQQGVMSRREARSYLQQGLIYVNNKKAVPGQKVKPQSDTVTLDSSVQKVQEEKTTVAVYKPRGVISSHDTDRGKNIFDVFPQYEHLHTVGRLDKESEGLILLSNDGLVTRAITNHQHLIEKQYVVTVREEVLPWMMNKMSEGMELEDGWTLPCETKKTGPHEFTITLKEGRKHQIRRMANACKLTIESLKRIRVHNIRIDGMMPGNVKNIDPEVIEEIKNIGI